MTISDGTNVHADTYGTGRGGMVRVQAASIMQDAGYITAFTSGVGQAGEVSVKADGNLTILNGGYISGTTSGAGSGGTLMVQAKNLAISRAGRSRQAPIPPVTQAASPYTYLAP